MPRPGSFVVRLSRSRHRTWIVSPRKTGFRKSQVQPSEAIPAN